MQGVLLRVRRLRREIDIIHRNQENLTVNKVIASAQQRQNLGGGRGRGSRFSSMPSSLQMMGGEDGGDNRCFRVTRGQTESKSLYA
jgi:hypothetical protein